MSSSSRTTTIVAISTPPGRGGIGVIRISGDDSLSLALKLIKDSSFDPVPQRAYLKRFYDPETAEVLDKGLFTYFKSPHSFTGEDVVELSCHGSPIVLLRIVDVLLLLGAHAAMHGEFTMRAVANKRLNLGEAEAIRDLINAQTYFAATQAIRQLNGELSARLQPLKNDLLSIIVPLESALEFVEDDLPHFQIENFRTQLSGLINKTETLASTYHIGRTLKDGYKIALVGRPNVGKSSTFNSLLAYERSIVTDIPGTTRDSLTEYIAINDVPISITDTAGVHSSDDEVERLGIERTKRAVVDADLALVIVDGSATLTSEDKQVLAIVAEHKHLIVANKVDLCNEHKLSEDFGAQPKTVVSISAKTGYGMEALRCAILDSLDGLKAAYNDNYLLTNARHYNLLQCTIESLKSSESLLEQRASEEIILVGLYNALRFLGDITGETTSEDILSEIFATFCIGK